MRKSFKNPRKDSGDLKRDLFAAGVNLDSSTIRRMLTVKGYIARRPKKQHILTQVMKKRIAIRKEP